MKPLPVKIAGVGRYLPKRVVSNSEVERLAGLQAGVIARSAAGVVERRWVDGETATWMGARAAEDALADAGMKAEDVDLIVNASATPEQAVPDGGPLIQRHLGLGDSGVPCFTVHATCVSFLVAFNMVGHLLASGQHRNVLIVSSDVASAVSGPRRPESFVLFGDGAGAVVVTAPGSLEQSQLDAYILRTFGSGAEYSQLRGWGTRMPPNDEGTRPEDNLLEIDGAGLHALVLQHGAETMEMLRPGLSRCLDDIALVVPHQPSLLALRGLYRAGIPREKVVVVLDKLGNCGGASLPLALYEAVREKRIRRGQKMLWLGAGAGLSLALAIVTY